MNHGLVHAIFLGIFWGSTTVKWQAGRDPCGREVDRGSAVQQWQVLGHWDADGLTIGDILGIYIYIYVEQCDVYIYNMYVYN